MRSVTAGLKTAMSATPRTLAWLGKFVFADGTTVRVSTTSQNVTFNDGTGSATWTKDKSFNVSSLKDRGDGTVPDGEIVAPAAISDAYDAEDVFVGTFEGMQITLYMVDYTDLADGAMQRGPYTVGEIGYDDRGRIATFEVRGILQRAKEITVEEFSVSCRSNFGDPRAGFCSHDIEAEKRLATVTAVTSDGDFTVSVTEPRKVDDWFANSGVAKWLTGDNAGTAQHIRAYTASTDRVQLWGTTRWDIQVGDTLDLYPGCNKTFAMCRDRWANSINFRGENLLPGTDFLNGAGIE